jgi:predicted dehydrogenase
MRVALVGAGGMAGHYRAVYARLPGVQWVLAVDVNEKELAACRAIGVQRTSSNFSDALAADIDMVDISTPNHLHEQQAVAALQAGKHVLLQKPMANTLAAADHILAAAAKAKGRLGMYMSAYNNPLVWEVKRLIDAGRLGKIQSVRARDAHRGGLRAQASAANWRGDRNQTGGGSFIQLSIHAINLMQWWLATTVTEVFAYSANQHCPNIGGDDVTTAVAKLNNGLLAVFESGWASDGMTREIYGTKGRINLREDDRFLDVILDEPYRGELIDASVAGTMATVARPAETDGFDNVNNPLNQQRMFIESLSAGRPPLNGGEIGRRDLAVVMAAYESARVGRPIKI